MKVILIIYELLTRTPNVIQVGIDICRAHNFTLFKYTRIKIYEYLMLIYVNNISHCIFHVNNIKISIFRHHKHQ